MMNRNLLLVMAIVLATALILSSLAFRGSVGTVSSEAQTTASPDINIFLNITGILGESQEVNHRDWIDIAAFNWSEAAAAIAAGRASGVATIKDFIFTTQTSRASPKLFLAGATGQIFPKATLECWTGSGEQTGAEFLKFQFDNVIITSYNIAGSTTDYRPLDQFSITFSKINMTYWMIDENGNQAGSVSAWYDLTTHSARARSGLQWPFRREWCTQSDSVLGILLGKQLLPIQEEKESRDQDKFSIDSLAKKN
jgi:type VI secretion system secreted protein Hcp